MKNGKEGPQPLPGGAALTPLELVLSKLPDAKRRGKGWRACCPAHDDQHPSLDIDVGDDGRVLLICRSANCSVDEICGALGIQVSELFEPSDLHRTTSKSRGKRRIIATYDYRDETGALLFQSVRYKPKDFVQRRPDGKGGWIWNLNGVRRVLYRLRELLDADPDAWVFVVEGEKDADRLREAGLTATTNPQGGDCWDKVDPSPLYERNVVSLRDNDEKGLRHRFDVLSSLVGKAKEVRTVDLPGLQHKGDVSDWLDAGHTVSELPELVEAAPRVTIVPAAAQPKPVPSEASGWDPPIPFGRYDVPEFPVEAIPTQLRAFREYCVAVSESLQVPLDSVVMLGLAVASASLAKCIDVEVQPDWKEPVNLYVAVAMESGERKSALVRRMVAPLIEFEERENEYLAPLIEQNQAELAMVDAELKQKVGLAARAKNQRERQEAKDRVQELVETRRAIEILLPLQLTADDATPEAIGQLLSQQGGRIALISPEGDVFDLMGGRYSDGAGHLGVYLKGHAGDDHRLNRVGRPSEYVKSPAITVGVAVQPDVLRGLAENKGFRGRGLLARFSFCLPKSRVGRRKLTPRPVSPEVASDYARLIGSALRIGKDRAENDSATPFLVTVAPEALEELNTFRSWVETELRPGGELHTLSDWGSKLPGAVCRIAGVFHGLIHSGGDPSAQSIDTETMLCAIAIGEYLVAHAKAAFSEMGTNPATSLARRIVDWLEEKQLTEFTERGAFNAMRGGAVQRVDHMKEPLRLLVEHGFIRERELNRSGPGRKPSPRYDVNPELYAHNTQNAQNGDSITNSADSAHSAQEEQE